MNEIEPQKAISNRDRAAEVQGILNAVQAGEKISEERVKDLLRGPSGSFVVNHIGNTGYQARRALIARVSDGNPVAEQAVIKKVDQLRDELAGKNASPMEQLLADRVAMCWLQIADADRRAATCEPSAIREVEYLSRLQDRAHRRLLSAIKTLATVRRMASPIQLDVNLSASAQPRHTGIVDDARAITQKLPRFAIDQTN